MRRGGVRFSMALAVSVLGGCALWPDGDDPVPADIESVRLEMARGVNGHWPAPVHLVHVRTQALVDTLLSVDVESWFDGGGARRFRDAHPEAVFGDWEVVPGSRAGPFDVRLRGDSAAVLLCGVASHPPPRRVSVEGAVLITIRDSGCEIVESSDG